MPDLTPMRWLLLVASAVCIGLGKSGFAGVGMIAVILITQIFPNKSSSGLVLPMLIVADVFAVATFRKFTVWSHLVRLLPPAMVGVICGWLLLPHISDKSFGPLIGWLTLGLVFLMILQKLTNRLALSAIEHPGIAWPVGWVAGVTTMLANAAGPVMTIYLLAARLPKYEFAGTGAWYFLIVNVAKIPFSVNLKFITPGSLLLNAALVPGIIGGIFLGRWLLGKINQTVFEWLMIVFSILGALRLVLS